MGFSSGVEVGQTYDTKSGLCEVVDYLNCDTVTVKWDDGSVRRVTSYELKRGDVSKSTKVKVGDVVDSPYGKCTIERYESCYKIHIIFENGGKSVCTAANFRKGNVKNPLSTTARKYEDSYVTPLGLKYSIVHVASSTEVAIRFEATGTVLCVSIETARAARLVDPMHRTVAGVGFLGIGQYKSSYEGTIRTAYETWRGMIGRCYSNPPKVGYEKVSVCDEWHNFQNFASWFYDNHIIGYHLDKDLTSWNCNIYSPATCAYIKPKSNSIYNRRDYNFAPGTNVIKLHNLKEN